MNTLYGTDGTFELYGDGDSDMEAGEIWLTPGELLDWDSGGDKGGGGDHPSILDHDLDAAFLNTLKNHAISDGTGDPAVDPAIADFYENAVRFVLKWDANVSDDASNGRKKEQQSD